MILVRSPLRITLGGGGTDLPSYASRFGGVCLTAAIDRYVYVGVLRPFLPGIYLKYSSQEHVATVAEIQHPIFRETLALFKEQTQIEITTLADIPAGTGLGSSSSFTTALVKALALHAGRTNLSPKDVAQFACTVEMTRLGAPIGPQDAYAAAYGGVKTVTVEKDGTVEARPLRLSAATLQGLEDGLLLFFTGIVRPAGALLRDQQDKTASAQAAMLDALHEVKALGLRTRDALVDGDLPRFGSLLDEHWTRKAQRSPGMSTPEIDGWYALAKKHGAIGGKLVGAGGGGCLLLYTESPRRVRAGLKHSGLQEIRFRFDWEGTKVLFA